MGNEDTYQNQSSTISDNCDNHLRKQNCFVRYLKFNIVYPMKYVHGSIVSVYKNCIWKFDSDHFFHSAYSSIFLEDVL